MKRVRSNDSTATEPHVHRSTGEARTRPDTAAELARDLILPLSEYPNPLQLQALQRTIGNRATSHLLSQRKTVVAQPLTETSLTNEPSSDGSLNPSPVRTIQRATHLDPGKLNVVGENHGTTEGRLAQEKKFCAEKTSSPNYWEESELLHRPQQDAKPVFADPVEQRALQSAAALAHLARDKMYPAAKAAVDDGEFLSTPEYNEAATLFRNYGQVLDEERDQFTKYWETEYNAGAWPAFEEARQSFSGKLLAVSRAGKKPSEKSARKVALSDLENSKNDMLLHWLTWRREQDSRGVRGGPDKLIEGRDTGISMERSIFMDEAAKGWAVSLRGVWKVGQQHVDEILGYRREPTEYNLVPKSQFDDRLREG